MANQDILNGMMKDMGSLIKKSEQLMKMIPDEAKTHLPNAQMDIRNISNALKNGDYSKVIDIQNKYANASEVLMKKD